MLFGKKYVPKHLAGVSQEYNVVKVPEETESKQKRYESPGYLLLHPEQKKKAMVWLAAYYMLFMLFLFAVIGYAAVEIQSFIFLHSQFGILR